MNAVEAYRRRRANRLKARYDADDVDWITTKNGEHVPLKDGKAVGGPMEGETFSEAESTKSATKKPRKKPKRKQKPVDGWFLNDYGKVRKPCIEDFDKEALEKIKEETGYSEEEAQNFQKHILDYFHGWPEDMNEEKTRIIEDGLSRMGAYKGPIYRGMQFWKTDEAEYKRWANMDAFEKLYEADVGDELKMKGLSSWSSEKFVGEDFGGMYNPDAYSVILVCNNNKSGVGVQHISHFAEQEAEVVAPSTARWRIKSKDIRVKSSGKAIVRIEVEEI